MCKCTVHVQSDALNHSIMFAFQVAIGRNRTISYINDRCACSSVAHSTVTSRHYRFNTGSSNLSHIEANVLQRSPEYALRVRLCAYRRSIRPVVDSKGLFAVASISRFETMFSLMPRSCQSCPIGHIVCVCTVRVHNESQLI